MIVDLSPNIGLASGGFETTGISLNMGIELLIL
jgi:hypothetical protein